VITAYGASVDQYVCLDNICSLEASERSEASEAKPNKVASPMTTKICWSGVMSQTPHKLSSPLYAVGLHCDGG
jgi:hypothetical protein